MPIVLLPPPQRVHITRENYALGQPAAMAVPPGTPAEVIEALHRAGASEILVAPIEKLAK